MKNLKVCIDLSNEFSNDIGALNKAGRERQSNILNENNNKLIGIDSSIEQLLIESINDSEKLIFVSSIRNDTKIKLQELAMYRDKFWKNGKKLNIKFLGGSIYLQEKIKEYAKKWEQHANIKFNFIKSGNADIRISFESGKGSWSYVGTDALNISDQNEATMNFGWFDDNTPEVEFSRTILHEFGHCLGCAHEHQSPDANINWNKPVIYAYYKNTQSPPWEKEKVDVNFFENYEKKQVTNSIFDPKSIMHYPIPQEFTLDNFSVPFNDVLSPNDIKFISMKYNKR